MTDPGFIEDTGDYDGRAWFGNIWASLNMTVVTGLEESGRPDLAAELNWATIKEFHEKYREYLLPSSGEGKGAVGYTWSASLYIGAIIDHLFGVSYDAVKSELRIAPHVPKALYGKDIELAGLILPTATDTRLSVHIRQTSASAAVVHVDISGALPPGELELEHCPTTQRAIEFRSDTHSLRSSSEFFKPWRAH